MSEQESSKSEPPFKLGHRLSGHRDEHWEILRTSDGKPVGRSVRKRAEDIHERTTNVGIYDVSSKDTTRQVFGAGKEMTVPTRRGLTDKSKLRRTLAGAVSRLVEINGEPRFPVKK